VQKGNIVKRYKIDRKWIKAKIQEIEVSRETGKCLFIAGIDHRGRPIESRENKISEYYEFHESWDIAHARLMEIANGNVLSARRRLEEANSTLGNIKGMKCPQPSVNEVTNE
jgi:hypothetical protein